MADYKSMDKAALDAELAGLRRRYDAFMEKGLKLDMSRGKPGPDQLDLSLGLFDQKDYIDEDGVDTRNYGGLDGIGEARRFFASEILGTRPEETLVGGNASLDMMYGLVDMGWRMGFAPGQKPWKDCETIKFICPVPGYDRHFRVTETFGFGLVSVPMLPTGPDMDAVEALAADEAVKGIWVVPVYSNPDGYTCSADTVQRLAAMRCAAPDFRIFWDNAYGVHHLTDTPDTCPNLLQACRDAGNEDRALMFCSTSKITFAGAGVGAMAASAANLARFKEYLLPKTIGYNKVNQLHHVRFLKAEGGVAAHMKKHAAILAPKFRKVLDTLHGELSGCGGIVRWTEPKGGYFISLFTLPGCAKRVVQLCKEAGVVLTGAGAAYPCGVDPDDHHIRIAPTYPPVDELGLAAELLCITTRMASIEKLAGAL